MKSGKNPSALTVGRQDIDRALVEVAPAVCRPIDLSVRCLNRRSVRTAALGHRVKYFELLGPARKGPEQQDRGNDCSQPSDRPEGAGPSPVSRLRERSHRLFPSPPGCCYSSLIIS